MLRVVYKYSTLIGIDYPGYWHSHWGISSRPNGHPNTPEEKVTLQYYLGL